MSVTTAPAAVLILCEKSSCHVPWVKILLKSLLLRALILEVKTPLKLATGELPLEKVKEDLSGARKVISKLLKFRSVIFMLSVISPRFMALFNVKKADISTLADVDKFLLL